MSVRRFLILSLLVASACKPPFNAGGFGSTEALYEAAMKEYNARHWENATRAFERFSRGEDARARGGSGLGLAIVEAVAHAHGGTAGIARNGTRPGADVWISLPAHPTP